MLLPKLKNEHNLLQRIAESDESAFKELFLAYHQQLGVFVNSLLNNRESTAEVIQDIFVKLWTQRMTLPNLSDFTAYLFIITRNYTLNKTRQELNEKRKLDSYRHEQYFQLGAHHDEFEIRKHRLVEKAVHELPPQQQKVFSLRQQGLKNGEIAERLKISTGSVAKYQQLALKYITDYVKAFCVLLTIGFSS